MYLLIAMLITFTLFAAIAIAVDHLFAYFLTTKLGEVFINSLIKTLE